MERQVEPDPLPKEVGAAPGVRGPRFSDVLMTLSTMLAAVAAICSAYAAFRQEGATYISNLYSKQVDAAAALLAADGRNVMMLGRFRKDHNDGLAANKLVPDDEVARIAVPDDDAWLKYSVAAILLPNNIVLRLRDINTDLGNARLSVLGAFGKNATEMGLKQFDFHLAVLDRQVNAIRACLAAQFKLGAPISDPPFDACIAEQEGTGGKR